MADVTYASNGKANLAVTLGAIGTGLGAIAGAGGLNALLGRQPNGGDPGDRPVSRYEMGLITENAQLKAQQYSDAKAAALQMQISQQAVWNATQEGLLRCQQQQLAQLYSLTQLTIPNSHVMPGWGPVEVRPAPIPAPVTDATTSTPAA